MNEEQAFSALRQRMLAEIAAETIYSSARLGKAALRSDVMDVMAKVPRHEFVLLELQPYAYANMPLPSGFGKTISQPFIVAVMTDLLDLQPGDVVLETLSVDVSERGATRMDDMTSEASMEKRKKDGYF